MNTRYSSVHAEWGNIFGLLPDDLTDEQINKIDVRKLIEMSVDNKRVEKILAEKILSCDIEHYSYLKTLNSKDIEKVPLLIEAYNSGIYLRDQEIIEKGKDSWRNIRGEYVMFNLLNDLNRARELSKWVNNESSVADPRKIDFNWLCESHRELADRVINKIIDDFKIYYKEYDPIPKMIKILPKEYLEKYYKIILSNCKSSIINAYFLCNPNVSENYIEQGLRVIAGKSRIPNINAKISKKILCKLPPVTRLEALETLLLHTHSEVVFEDIHEAEDLEQLLFSTSLKYNDRIKKVVRIFRSIKNK